MTGISTDPQNKTNAQNGSVLTWAIVLLLVLTLLITSSLTFSLGYLQNSINNNSRRQAYLTARAAVDVLAKKITSSSAEEADVLLSGLSASQSVVTVDPVRFDGMESAMGSCRATLQREPFGEYDSLLITATATVGGQSQSVSLRLRGQSTPAEETPGDDAGFSHIVIDDLSGQLDSVMHGFSTDSNTNIYVSENCDRFEVNITSNGKSPVIGGNIYSKSPLYIRNDYYLASHVHGTILSDADVYLEDNVTIGPFTGCCPASSPASELYTTGLLSSKDASRIYSAVTAERVVLSNETICYNTVHAHQATLQNNATIEGDVTANTLIMSSQTIIRGDVVAGSITMSGNAIIYGNVTAGSITISQGGKIQGNVTAGEVTVSGSWQNPAITGNLTAESAVSADVRVGGTLIQGIPYTHTSTPVAPLVSRIPAPPADPVLPARADHAAQLQTYSSGQQVLGHTDGSDSYYVVSGSLDVPVLRSQGEGHIFLYVPSGSSLKINECSPARPQTPNVFIIVESGGSFERANVEADTNMDHSMYKSFYGYIFGEPDAFVRLGRGTSLYGGVRAAHLQIGIDVTLNALPIASSSSSTPPPSSSSPSSAPVTPGGDGSSDGSGTVWSIIGYEPTVSG